MSRLPKDPKRIKDLIRRYERDLANEIRKFGGIHDGAGRRYLLGRLYMMLGDIEGARKSFTWFQRMFPDDIGEPFHYLCWTLALYRAGESEDAAKKLAQTWFGNVYLVSRLLGVEQQKLDIRHGTNWELPEYVADGPLELLDLWDEDALVWAREVYDQAWFNRVRSQYLEIARRLETEPVGPERNRLVNEKFQLMRLDGTDMR